MNAFDPRLMVRVVDVTQGVPPDVLYYTTIGAEPKTEAAPPEFERSGDPEYVVPRYYAERLLENAGGRTFRLVEPPELMVRMPNGQGGTTLKTLRAYKKRGENLWTEVTDEEIALAKVSASIVGENTTISSIGGFADSVDTKVPMPKNNAFGRAKAKVKAKEAEVSEVSIEPIIPDVP